MIPIDSFHATTDDDRIFKHLEALSLNENRMAIHSLSHEIKKLEVGHLQ